MADNSTQTGADTIATDELVTLNGAASTGVKAQRVKVGYGDDGIFRDASAAFPLPVILAGARVPVVLSASGIASAVTEALFTLNIYRGGTVTSATSYTVTAGKTLRITAVQFGSRFATPSTTATFANTRFNFRATTGAALATNSPLVYSDTKMSAANTPTPNSDLAIPDGLDFAAGSVIGVSHADSAATLLLDVLLVGYEY